MWLRDKAEWRTLALIGVCYLSLGLLVVNPFGISLFLQVILIIPLITLHSSLQHECIHGHPFASQNINDAIVFPPVGVLLPYFRFKASHIKHHQNASISDPYDDPESGYQDMKIWVKRPNWVQKIFEVNNTLAGRMLIGPTLSVIGFAIAELRRGERNVTLTWMDPFCDERIGSPGRVLLEFHAYLGLSHLLLFWLFSVDGAYLP